MSPRVYEPFLTRLVGPEVILILKQDSRTSKGTQHICISHHHIDYSLMEVLVIEYSYFLIYHNMTRTMIYLKWTCFEQNLQLSMCLRTMQFNLIILFVALGSSVITATELKWSSSNPAIAAYQPHKVQDSHHLVEPDCWKQEVGQEKIIYHKPNQLMSF